jgi:hypothetical protein
MKNIEKLLFVAAASVALAAQAGADEPLLSPRAKANQVVTVSGTTEDQLYRGTLHLQRGWFAAPTVVASGGALDVDYVHNTAVITVSPRALATFPHLANVASVAPLK